MKDELRPQENLLIEIDSIEVLEKYIEDYDEKYKRPSKFLGFKRSILDAYKDDFDWNILQWSEPFD